MALTTTQANNKLIKFRKEVWREYVRENLFSPYMGTFIERDHPCHYRPQQGRQERRRADQHPAARPPQ